MPRLQGTTEGLIRLRLFFVSYVPLWAMLSLRAVPANGWHWNGRTALVIIFATMAICWFIDAIRLIRGSGRTGSRSLFFREINDQGGNAAGYLATYLLPFIGFVPTDWGDWAAYVLYLVVAAIVFIRTDLTFVNPTLYIMNHRIVSANAYLPDNNIPGILVSGSPFIVVCRDARALESSKVDVTSVGGGFVTKNEQRIGRKRQ